MPVKEVTVFKDGHAFVLHEGALPTDAAGNVLMDYLPSPVLGTFWPYSSNADVKLVGVVAGPAPGARRADRAQPRRAPRRQRRRGGDHHRENHRREPGAGSLRGHDRRHSAAQLRRARDNRAAERGAANAGEGQRHPRPDRRRREGRARREHPGRHVQDAAQEQAVARRVPQPAHAEARLGEPQAVAHRAGRPVYVQKGLRWIPGYRVTLDGSGTAAIKLQIDAGERADGPDRRDRQPGDRRAELRLQGHDRIRSRCSRRWRSCRRTSSRAIAMHVERDRESGRGVARRSAPQRRPVRASAPTSPNRRRARTCSSSRSGT